MSANASHFHVTVCHSLILVPKDTCPLVSLATKHVISLAGNYQCERIFVTCFLIVRLDLTKIIRISSFVFRYG